MDMSMTSAVATIIQAVSPVSIFSGGAGAGATAAAAGAGCAWSSAKATAPVRKRPTKRMITVICFMTYLLYYVLSYQAYITPSALVSCNFLVMSSSDCSLKN
jgi:hypothetical protein